MTKLLTLVTLLTFFVACSKEKKMDMAETDSKKIEMPEKKSDALNEHAALTSDLIKGYLAVKDALVSDSKDDAAKAAEVMLTAYKNFPIAKLNADQHKTYMEIAENSKEQLEHIVKSPIDHQREHFESLSSDTYDLVKLLGSTEPLFKEFCPMYNKNKGGMWLSASNKIRNPYFGSRMLKCGKVQEEI